MKENNDLKQRIRSLLESQLYAILSSVQKDGAPYSNIVGFAMSDDLKNIIFTTPVKSRKFNNMVNEPRVSMMVDSRSNRSADILDADAVTILGEAKEAGIERKHEFLDIYRKRHPQLNGFAMSPNSALMHVRVKTYLYICRFEDIGVINMSTDEE